MQHSLTPIYTFFTHLLQLQQHKTYLVSKEQRIAYTTKCPLNRIPRCPLGGHPSHHHFPLGLILSSLYFKRRCIILTALLKGYGEENVINRYVKKWQQYTNLHSEIEVVVYTWKHQYHELQRYIANLQFSRNHDLRYSLEQTCWISLTKAFTDENKSKQQGTLNRCHHRSKVKYGTTI